MRKIFISYGDDSFRDELKRIGGEAKKLGIFDAILLLTPDKLPVFIKSSPLMGFKRGGGFWVWKPYVIWEILQKYDEGDIVVYADAGCCLRKSMEWEHYFNEVKITNTILFHYREDFDYGWKNIFNCGSTKIKHWTKKNTLSHFDKLFGNQGWREFNKIWAGFIICRGRNNLLIKEWLTTTLMRPDLIIDPFGNELADQEDYYCQHRHDQSILTPLGYFYAQTNEVLILPETGESQKDRTAVYSKRLQIILKESMKTKLIRFVKCIIGEKFYNIVHCYR